MHLSSGKKLKSCNKQLCWKKRGWLLRSWQRHRDRAAVYRTDLRHLSFSSAVAGYGGILGTGMGLAICKRIVKRYRGHIWVDTEPGKGSPCYFTLPIQEPAVMFAWQGTALRRVRYAKPFGGGRRCGSHGIPASWRYVCRCTSTWPHPARSELTEKERPWGFRGTQERSGPRTYLHGDLSDIACWRGYYHIVKRTLAHDARTAAVYW